MFVCLFDLSQRRAALGIISHALYNSGKGGMAGVIGDAALMDNLHLGFAIEC